jgi:hypothetical protein
VVAGTSPDDFVITNDSSGNPSSVKMVLQDVQHFDGATSRYEFSFSNSSDSPIFGSQSSTFLQELPVGNASAVVYDNNGQPYSQTSVVGYFIDGQNAGLTSLFPETFGLPDQAGHPAPFCNNCDFLKWGAAGALVTFSNNENSVQYVDLINPSWWVAGDVATSSPLQGSASYGGHAVGTVVTNLFAQNLIATNLAAAESPGSTWTTYLAAGNLDMSWNFGSRTGDLTISKFDASHFNDGQGLSFAGAMCAPGVTGCATTAGNHFGGSLTGSIDANLRLLGAANGVFVRAPGQLPGAVPAGAIGNWYISGNGSQGAGYKASGIFAGSNVPTSLNTLNLANH